MCVHGVEITRCVCALLIIHVHVHNSIIMDCAPLCSCVSNGCGLFSNSQNCVYLYVHMFCGMDV